MQCNCTKLAETCIAEPSEFEFVEDFIHLDVDQKYWRELYKCSNCNQVWVVEHEEIMNKFPRLAFKLTEQENWLEYDYTTEIEKFKVKKHGGLSEKNCLIKGCDKKSLLNTYLCAAHLTAT